MSERIIFSIIVYLLYIALILFCILAFVHPDMAHTTISSLALLDGHVLDFYDYNKADPTLNGNNYLISTYIIFAFFLSPLKPFGVVGRYKWMLWYGQLITAVFFFLSAYLIYKIVLTVFKNKNSARLAAILWVTNPFAFYSEFIFSQYDIFTVFFVLLGFYGYVSKNTKLFYLSFLLAVTFKYHALLIYVPLVLLRFKNFAKILISGIIVSLLFIAEVAIYIKSEAFIDGVFGFGAVQNSVLSGIPVLAEKGISINLFIFSWLAVCALSFFVHPENDIDEQRWGVYFSLAALNCLFIFSYWHLQWIILVMPFFSLILFSHKQANALLFIDLTAFIIFSLYILFCIKDGSYYLLFKGSYFTYNPAIDTFPMLKTGVFYTCVSFYFFLYSVLTFPPLCKRMSYYVDEPLVSMKMVYLRFLLSIFGWFIICIGLPVLRFWY